MLITLFTDMSMCPDTLIGAWAAWAKCDGYTMRQSGVFKSKVLSTGHGELMAITNGLVCVCQLERVKAGDTVLIQTDSSEALHVLEKGPGAFVDRQKASKAIRRMRMQVYASFCATRSMHAVHVKLRHVKAHVEADKREPRHAVNHWCDTEAKRLMRQARDAYRNSLQPVTDLQDQAHVGTLADVTIPQSVQEDACRV